MDRIKFTITEKVEYPINAALFEEKTSLKPPHCADETNPKESTHYAVCPACDNPVQIIGLYKRLQSTDKPYAKHIPQSIEALATYVQENYDYCPLRAKRIRHQEYAKRLKGNELSLKIIQRLIEEFDRIIFFMEYKTGIFISYQFAKELVHRYFRNEGYLFYDASLNNIPLKLFHASFPAHRLYGRVIFNYKLQEALMKAFPQTQFVNNKIVSNTAQFIDVSFAFIHHEIHHAQERTEESIVLSVVTSQENSPLPRKIYKEKIVYDTQEYQEWVLRPFDKLTEKQQERSVTLLKIAKEEAKLFQFA